MNNELILLLSKDLETGQINSLQQNIHILTIEEKSLLLFTAVISNQKNILLFLIENGADINYVKQEENNLLIFALRYKKYSKIKDNDIINLIIDLGIDVRMFDCAAMFIAAVENNFAMLKKIIASGADIHARDNQLVLSVASSGNIEMMQYVLNSGVSIDKNGHDVRIAVNYGHLDMVKFLIDNGASIHSKNKEGYDAIMCAAMFEHLEIVQYLLKVGANIKSVFEYFKHPKDTYDSIFFMGKKGSMQPTVQDWCIKYIQ